MQEDQGEETYIRDMDISMLPKTLEECVTIAQQNLWLRNRVAMYEKDGMWSLFFSLNRKANEMAKSMNSFELDLTSNSKEPERFRDLVKLLPDLTPALGRMRQDYLRVDEQEAELMAKKGVPLIEQHNSVKGNKKKAAGKTAKNDYDL